ncbi:hypothetical protein ACI65C_007712 [Semiaphis heraclei]
MRLGQHRIAVRDRYRWGLPQPIGRMLKARKNNNNFQPVVLNLWMSLAAAVYALIVVLVPLVLGYLLGGMPITQFRPLSDVSSKNSSNDIDPNNENRIVLCSAKDKFVLGQDICVMCGSLGTDQEACLISCSQCGQCYHPFCVNVKVTKVILQKGWRCLDCTVCEGCGQLKNIAFEGVLNMASWKIFEIYC